RSSHPERPVAAAQPTIMPQQTGPPRRNQPRPPPKPEPWNTPADDSSRPGRMRFSAQALSAWQFLPFQRPPIRLLDRLSRVRRPDTFADLWLANAVKVDPPDAILACRDEEHPLH